MARKCRFGPQSSLQNRQIIIIETRFIFFFSQQKYLDFVLGSDDPNAGAFHFAKKFSVDEVDKIIKSGQRFAFINIWRSIDAEHPVYQKPLAVCDCNSLHPEEYMIYDLAYDSRTGHNYSLPGKRHPAESEVASATEAGKFFARPDAVGSKMQNSHKWYYFPKMVKDECLLFNVYDRATVGDPPRFVFHTAFDDPSDFSVANSHIPRQSVEARAVVVFKDEAASNFITTASAAEPRRPIFFDMVHSNNAGRIRLWLRLKGIGDDVVQTKMCTYDDLTSEEFLKVNPYRKIPAMIMATGEALPESQVEEKFEKYFGYLARCEENFGAWTLQNRNFGLKFDENAEIDSAKN